MKKFGNDNLKISRLGFGCMRLPIIDNNTENIDKEKAIEMIRYAIDNGVNYVDTAYPYHGGKSEGLVSLALKDGYRQKVFLADKLPIWLIKEKEDMDKYFNEQLERLDDSSIDFYLLHALNKKTFETIKKLNICKWAEEKRNEGKIKYLGFSFHDDLDTFKEIIDYYDWDFCQIQLNYMDTDYQAGLEGLKYAYERNIPVIIMEPIKGGSLAVEPKGDIKKTYDKFQYEGTPAELALRYLFDRPEVAVVLSGMSTLEHVKENLNTVKNYGIGNLTDKENILINELKDIYNERLKVSCTECEYCLPCPQKVNIPGIFEIYNELSMYGNTERSKYLYTNFVKKNEQDVSQCIECGSCEEKCPQNINIIEKLKEAEKAIIGN